LGREYLITAAKAMSVTYPVPPHRH